MILEQYALLEHLLGFGLSAGAKLAISLFDLYRLIFWQNNGDFMSSN